MPPSSNAARVVTVSYSCLPSSFDFRLLEPELLAQVPLRNLHWKSTNRSIRTIQQLPVQFKPLSTLGDDRLPLLEKPYLHLLFVISDDNEAYRATLRSEIREWLDRISQRRDNEWLIVHVTSGSTLQSSKFYQRKGSVVDKIRADFNTGKRDRCVQVAQHRSDDPTAWAEFSTKAKEGIVATFDSNVTLYEEDVRKADSQRQLDGWQYLPFFLQKEGLADSFEAMNLIEDALIQYDELEASFFQSLKDHNMSWFGQVGGLSPGDDALPLLSTTNKNYRQMIANNKISIFDFRIYLFARQALMLSRLGRITEVAKRGAYFISTFARTLRESQRDLGPNFVESWTYSACLNIVDSCQRWLGADAPSSPALTQFTAVKAELLELARKQLDKIGIGAGHLPPIHPFSMSLNESLGAGSGAISPSAGASDRPPVSRQDLLDAIADEEAFDKLYVDVTNRTIHAYQSSGRRRCSLKMHASLAALEDHRHRYASAQKLYSNLPAHYVDHRWVKIESSLLTQCTRLQGQLDMAKERLLSTLALVRAGVEQGSKAWTLDPPDFGTGAGEDDGERRTGLAKELMKDVYDLSGKLTKDFAAIAFPTFSMRLASDRGQTAQDEDGVTVALVVTSLLPCPLRIDEVRLKFSTAEGEQVWFTAGATHLALGDNPVTLFCPTAICGRLALELSQIRYSRIIFQYSHRPPVAGRPGNGTPVVGGLVGMVAGGRQPQVWFPRDERAVDVWMEGAEAIYLDRDRTAVVCLAAGRNEVVKAQVKMQVAGGEASLDLARAQLISGVGKLSTANGDTLVFEGVPAGAVVKVELPLVGTPRGQSVEIGLLAEYFTTKRPSTRRTLRRSVRFAVALPLAVNVQDFFRRDCLLSKFTVTTDGARALRIRGAELGVVEGEGQGEGAGVVVRPCRSANAPAVVVNPRQTATFLFKVVREGEGAEAGGAVPLRLVITYAEVEETEKAKRRMTVKGGQEEGGSDQEAETVWRRLIIPVDLPALDILNLVSLTPAYSRTQLGLPLPITLSITPTFAWARTPHPADAAPLVLTYDLAANAADWLVSGRKKGRFDAREGGECVVELVLVPVRAGRLFLPSVAIRVVREEEEGGGQGQGGGRGRGMVGCETQHLNAGVGVEVLPVRGRSSWRVEVPGERGVVREGVGA